MTKENQKRKMESMAEQQRKVAKALDSMKNDAVAPWDRERNKSTSQDLRQWGAEHYLHRIRHLLGHYGEVDAAKGKDLHLAELKKLETMAGAFLLGIERIKNATRKAPKHRDELQDLFMELERGVVEYEGLTSIDLMDFETWRVCTESASAFCHWNLVRREPREKPEPRHAEG
jgi:hypothetical protein